MEFKLIINGELTYGKPVPKHKQQLEIYEYYEYLIKSCKEYFRQTWFYKMGINPMQADIWYQTLNTYLNKARKTTEPKTFIMNATVNDINYTIQIVDEKLNLTDVDKVYCERCGLHEADTDLELYTNNYDHVCETCATYDTELRDTDEEIAELLDLLEDQPSNYRLALSLKSKQDKAKTIIDLW